MNVELLKAHANGLPEMLANAEAIVRYLRGVVGGASPPYPKADDMLEAAEDLAADLATLCEACEDE